MNGRDEPDACARTGFRSALATLAAVFCLVACAVHADEHHPPMPIQGIVMPPAPTMAASMALLRQRSPVLWAAKRCRSVTIAPYLSRWRTMSYALMNDEITSLYDACLVAVMPAGWSSGTLFRKQATSAYQRARIGDPQFLPPDFLKTYDIE